MESTMSLGAGVLSGTFLLCLFSIGVSHIYPLITSYRLGCKNPPTYPILSSIKLFFGIQKRLQRHTVMPGQSELHKHYGLTFRNLGFTSNTIFTLDPVNIRTVWATSFREWGVETPRMQVLGPFCGRGVVTVDGAQWEKTRDLLRPHFYGSTAAKIDLDVLEKYIGRYFNDLPGNGKIIDLQPLIYDMYFEAGYEFLLGEPLKNLPGYESVPIESIRNWLDYGVVGSRKRFLQGPLKHLKTDKKWIQARDSMQQFTETVISRARQMQVKTSKIANEELFSIFQAGQPNTLINRFISGFQDPIDLRSLVLQYFMGTSFTVSSVVTNACYLLSKSPEVWGRLREEVLSQQDSTLPVETVKAMPYLKRIFDESLRLFPLTTIEFRTALKDTILPTGGGHTGSSPIFAPKGTTLATSIWSLHRQESVFGEDVNDFNPDRWETHRPNRWEYIPFGGGPRVCIGQEKAQAESMYILARLAQKFERMNGCEAELSSRNGQEMLGCRVTLQWAAKK